MPAAEIILIFCALAQVFLLVFPRRDSVAPLVAALSAAGLGGAGLYLVFSSQYVTETLSWGPMLQDAPLFRLPRAALLFAALLIGRAFVATSEVPEGRKPEALFLLSVVALACDLLLLSRHALLSCILLVALSWLSIFLSGFAFRGRVEGEALLKFWAQASLAAAVGFGAVLLLALIAGGLHFDLIASFIKEQPIYAPTTWLLVVALALPFFLLGGVFPFHFVSVDRDQGVPWAVQLVLGVMVQGALFLALWKLGVEVFGAARGHGPSEGMRVLQAAGLAGGFWLTWFAFTQENSKRLFAALVGAQWSAILAAGSVPSALGLSSVTYAFASAFLWASLLGFTWSRMQEASGGPNLSHVHGAAKIFRGTGLFLLLALGVPLCVPGLPGFPAVLHLLAATIEQKSILLLLAEAALLAFLCLSCLRVGIDLLFRPAASAVLGQEARIRYAALDGVVLVLLALALVALGVLWDRAFAALVESAKAFVI